MPHTISFQYLGPDDEMPRSDYDVMISNLELPEGMHVPRIGEFVQFDTVGGINNYVVMAVHTRILMLGDDEFEWHTVVTLGPDSQVTDRRLLMINAVVDVVSS